MKCDSCGHVFTEKELAQLVEFEKVKASQRKLLRATKEELCARNTGSISKEKRSG